MRLLVISHMPHYMDSNKKVYGWGPTAEEIEHLARLFDKIRHIGCLHPGPIPQSALPYLSSKIEFIPVPPAGGVRWRDKISVLLKMPLYISKIIQELSSADVVHVRCPANISLTAIIVLAFVRYPKYRWVKYAGNWKPPSIESWSYTFQRWWLQKGLHRGTVTINGSWPKQPSHVLSFCNPCLTQEDLQKGRDAARNKQLASPSQLLFVGALEGYKGVAPLIDIAKKLQTNQFAFELHIVGDGSERKSAEKRVQALGLEKIVFFHGWKPKNELGTFYERAHFLILPSSSEGWPKVLSEAMAYGVVPVTSAVSCIPQMLREVGSGVALPPQNVKAFAEAIQNYVDHTTEWKKASEAGIAAAPLFTYEAYLSAVQKMFTEAWGIELGK